MSNKILIIEDEAPIRRLMTMALEPAYQVSVAEDGAIGLARFGDGSEWLAVLLDQRMPGLEGLEVLRRIKAINASVPVIMITAYPSIDLAVDAMKIGAVDFLRKPVTPDILRAAVAAATRERAPRAPTAPRRPDRPDIETITMNGFRIVHEASDPGQVEHRFRVFAGAGGAGSEVLVQITPEARAKVEQLVSRHFEPASLYWQVLAENYLAAFLWNDQHIPQKPIVLRDVTAEDLDAANFWPGAE